MARRIEEAVQAGLGHPSFDGIPHTTGTNPPTQGPGAEAAMKLLMFVDGSSSLRDLAEVLSIDAGQMVRMVTILHEAGVLVFEDGWTGKWLSEPQPVPAHSTRAATVPPAQDGSEQEQGEERIRVLGPVPSPTMFPEPPRASADPVPVAGEPEEAEAAEALPEEVAAGEIVEEGRLDEIPAWQLVTRLGRSGFKGWLRTTVPEGRREILFNGGVPVYASSEVAGEDLGTLLRGKESISDDDLERLRAEREGSGGDDGRILVRLGMLPEYNRLRAVRWQVQTILFGALQADKGTYVLEKLETLPMRVPKFDINFSRVLTRFLDEKLPVDVEIKKLEEKLEFYIVPTGSGTEPTFQEKEQRMWQIVKERPRRLKDMLTLTTMFRRDTYKFVLLLLVNGLVEITKSVVLNEGPIDLRLLDDIADDMAHQNYFEVLAVHAVSDTQDIEAAFNRMTAKFDPAAFHQIEQGPRAVLLACRARIDEAWNGLKAEDKRNEYRKQVFTQYQLAQFGQLQYQKGEIFLWWRQDPRAAYQYFRSAFELDPTQPLFWAGYALCTIAGGMHDPAVRQQALKLAERVAGLQVVDPVALVMAGGALLKSGNVRLGEEAIQRGVKLAGASASIQKMATFVTRGSED